MGKSAKFVLWINLGAGLLCLASALRGGAAPEIKFVTAALLLATSCWRLMRMRAAAR